MDPVLQERCLVYRSDQINMGRVDVCAPERPAFQSEGGAWTKTDRHPLASTETACFVGSGKSEKAKNDFFRAVHHPLGNVVRLAKVEQGDAVEFDKCPRLKKAGGHPFIGGVFEVTDRY
jgi:hypothetical protein